MSSNKKIGDIQILRAIAITLVLMQHLSITATLNSSLPNHGSMPFWAGVELFFVISGLVVTQSILSRDLEPGRFIVRRAFRLLPAIFFFLFISGGVIWIAQSLPKDSWGYQSLAVEPRLFFYQGISIIGGFFINIPSNTIYQNGAMWSLSVEFQFYAFFALWMAVIMAFNGCFNNFRKITLIFSIFIYIIVLLQRIYLLFGQNIFDMAIINYIRNWRFDFLILGVIIAFIKINPKSWGPTASILLLLIPLFIAAVSEDILSAGSHPFLEGFAMPIMGLSFAALCLLAKSDSAFHGHGTSIYALMYWIGDRSYSIYLLHYPVMGLVWMCFFWYAPSLFSGAILYGVSQAVLVMAITFPLADFSFRFIEMKGQRIGKNFIEAVFPPVRSAATVS